ncbi:MAG: bifunctional 5,10-methylenetetrahydrofolate dehydrogenase/5,10-methenyltetrahydrofolate cyclohydrolase [Patescibacteria group bacterium]
MMIKKIDGKKIAERVKDEIAEEIYHFKGLRPNLAIILVGERPDSKMYVALKEKEAKKVGIDAHIYRLDADIPEEELLKVISFLNNDEIVDGILIQLPLPSKFNTDKIIESIDPEKDVDGFHSAHPDYILSPVLASIKICLGEINFQIKEKIACVLYNSEIFGNSVKDLLEEIGIEKITDKPEEADLLITALGKPHFIKKENIKEGTVIIDIGITQVGEEVLGDVDYNSVKEKGGYITPVPGGIGPLTIAFLFKNVLTIFKKRRQDLGK